MFNVPGLAELFAKPLTKITFPIEKEKLCHPYLERFHLKLQRSVDLGRPNDSTEASARKEVCSEKNRKKKERKKVEREVTNAQSDRGKGKSNAKAKPQSNKKKQDKGKNQEMGRLCEPGLKQKKQETISFIDDDPTLVLPERNTAMKHRWPTTAKPSSTTSSTTPHKWPVVNESSKPLDKSTPKPLLCGVTNSLENLAIDGYDLVGCLLGEKETSEKRTFSDGTTTVMSAETSTSKEKIGLITKDFEQKSTCQFVKACSLRPSTDKTIKTRDHYLGTSSNINSSPCVSSNNSDGSDNNNQNSNSNNDNTPNNSSNRISSFSGSNNSCKAITINSNSAGNYNISSTTTSWSNNGDATNNGTNRSKQSTSNNIEGNNRDVDGNVNLSEESVETEGKSPSLFDCGSATDQQTSHVTYKYSKSSSEALNGDKYVENCHAEIKTVAGSTGQLGKKRRRVNSSKVASKKGGVGLLQSLKQLKYRTSLGTSKRSSRRTCATRISYKEADSSDELSICEMVDEVCPSPDHLEDLVIDLQPEEECASNLHSQRKRKQKQEDIQKEQPRLDQVEEEQESQHKQMKKNQFEKSPFQENLGNNNSSTYQLSENGGLVGNIIENKIEKKKTMPDNQLNSVETAEKLGEKPEVLKLRPGHTENSEVKEQLQQEEDDELLKSSCLLHKSNRDDSVGKLDAVRARSSRYKKLQTQNSPPHEQCKKSVAAQGVGSTAGHDENLPMLEEGEVLDEDNSFLVNPVINKNKSTNSEASTISSNVDNLKDIPGNSALNMRRISRTTRNSVVRKNNETFQETYRSKPENQYPLKMKGNHVVNTASTYSSDRKRKLSGGDSDGCKGDNTRTETGNTPQPTRRITRSVNRCSQPCGQEDQGALVKQEHRSPQLQQQENRKSQANQPSRLLDLVRDRPLARELTGENSRKKVTAKKKKKKGSSKYWDNRRAEIQREKEKREYDAKLPCVHYKTHGTCNYGDDCRYSHDIEVDPKKECCKYYVAGACNKGDSCRFIHDEWPCKFFHQMKRCTNPNCRFSHADMTPHMKELFDARMKYEDQLSDQQQQEEDHQQQQQQNQLQIRPQQQQQQQQRSSEVEYHHQYTPGTQTEELQPIARKNTPSAMTNASPPPPLDPSILSNPECGRSEGSNNEKKQDGGSVTAIEEFNFPSLYYELP